MKAVQYLAEAFKGTGLEADISEKLAQQIKKNQKILSICENDDRTQLRDFRHAKRS